MLAALWRLHLLDSCAVFVKDMLAQRLLLVLLQIARVGISCRVSCVFASCLIALFENTPV
jgi:hypothetical protein